MKKLEYIYTDLIALKSFIAKNTIECPCLTHIYTNDKLLATQLISVLMALNIDMNISTIVSTEFLKTTITFVQLPGDTEITNHQTASELNFFNSGPVVIFRRKIQDDCWVVTDVTKSVSQWGYVPKDFINSKEAMKTIFHNDDMEYVRNTLIHKVQAGKNKINQQYRINKADGSIAWVSEHTQVIRDAQGRAVELIGYLIDITQDKSNESLYKSIIDTTTEGFWLLDSEHKIIDVNNSLCLMLGFTNEEIIGKTPLDFISKQDHDLCVAHEGELKDGFNNIFEIDFNSKSGSTLHVLTNVTTMRDPDGNLKTFAFMSNISDQKKAQEELLRHKDDIEELNSSLESRVRQEVEKNREKEQMMYQQSRLASMGEMIGNIAHQWRQPLNIMALVMQDLYISDQLGNLTSKKIEESYEKSNNLLQYMSQTIDDFRNFFKHSDDNLEFSVKEALESVYSLVNTNLAYHHIDCKIDIYKDSIVKGGLNEFKQVLINIINNAQEAIQTHKNETKNINITISQEGTRAIVRIRDNGGGIKKNVINKIFDPYFTTKNQTQGTGLGLYMSKQIIENSMCGSLSVKNTDTGAEFTISVPVK